MVLFAVDEALLEFEEVGGEEDVAAEGTEEGVEGGGGGGYEGCDGAWLMFSWSIKMQRKVGGLGSTMFSPGRGRREGTG